MSKLQLAIVLGTVLGLIDGLLTFFNPEAVESGMMPMIITGSTLKGLVTGALIGYLATKFRSLLIGLTSGLGIGLLLSFLVALMPDPEGDHHYFEIMLPGAVLGVVVGFVAYRWGTVPKRPETRKMTDRNSATNTVNDECPMTHNDGMTKHE